MIKIKLGYIGQEYIEDIKLFICGILTYMFCLFVFFVAVILPYSGQGIDMQKVSNVINNTKNVVMVSYFMASPMPLTVLGAGKSIIYMVR